MASKYEHTTLAELAELSRARMGLIVGPGVTNAEPDFWDELKSHLTSKFSLDPISGHYGDVAERIVGSGVESRLVQKEILSFVGRTASAPIVQQMAKMLWTSIISVSLDDYLEGQLRSVHQKRPARRDVTVLSDPADIPPGNTVPIFKVLGSATNQNVATTRADILRRSTRLHATVRQFLTETKGSPVLCAGLGGAQWISELVLSHLLADVNRLPRPLVFLEDDPILQSESISQLVPAGLVRIVNASVVEAARALEPKKRSGQTSFSFSNRAGDRASVDLDVESDVLCIVNSKVTPDIAETEKQRLLDYLFMPDLPNWSPVAFGFDFERSITQELEQRLLALLAEGGDEHFLALLHGRAAAGKTTVLKRLAFNLAEAGYLVLWFQDSWHANVREEIEKVFGAIKQGAKVGTLILIADGPTRIRDFAVSAIFKEAEKQGMNAILVLGCRTTLYEQISNDVEGNDLAIDTHWELPDALDDDEWSRFPAYLVRLGIFQGEQEAKASVAATQHRRNARDSLALLYYLLPQTQKIISEAIAQEYFSLGDSQALREILVGAVTHSAQKLQDAYGMVAASTKYGTAVPVEVLVNALDIGYVEWTESVEKRGPAWGLLYPDDTDDLEGASYRTRNDVVTDAVLKAANGGVVGHSGEVALLRRLLAACDGSADVYVRFCERILVPHKNLDRLEYREGLELYDAAIRALPFAHRTLLHHKGLWVRKKGRELDLALDVFDEALRAPGGKLGEPGEAEEFIHTSKAAAIIDKLDSNQLDWDTAQQQASAELEKSRSPGFINAHAVHSYARLVTRLAFRNKQPPEVDQFELVNRALSDIDRTLMVLRSSRFQKNLRGSAEPLEQERASILLKFGDLPTGADRVWDEHRSQHGFVLATRSLLAKAIGRRDSGSEYREAFAYWSASKAKVEKETSISPELAEVGLALYFSWQVEDRSRHWKKTTRSPIDWALICECAEVTLRGRRFQRDPFYRFLYALALAHQQKWQEAHSLFQENRKLHLPPETLHTPRSYFLHPDGAPWRIQGRVTQGASRRYFHFEELQQDFETHPRERLRVDNKIVHAYVVFSFAGPMVTTSDRLCGRED